MRIDLHIHSSTGSDGALPVEGVLAAARDRKLALISITDHDSIAAQARARTLAQQYAIGYVTGIELNVTFPVPQGKTVSLDFLGYGFDPANHDMLEKLRVIRQHREWRAHEIMARVNAEFAREGLQLLTDADMQAIRASVDGVFARPHIAAYLVQQGIVRSTQEAFDRYLVKCDVPKYSLSLPEASTLVRGAGGILVLAHPNDPHGTSLASVSHDLREQARIVETNMLQYINGVECWHQRHDTATSAFYLDFARAHGLAATGGSDCHQRPIVMGTVDVPAEVARQFPH